MKGPASSLIRGGNPQAGFNPSGRLELRGTFPRAPRRGAL